MESGTPGAQGHRRRLDEPRAAGRGAGASPVRAVALGPVLPRTLRGPASPPSPWTAWRDFQVRDAGGGAQGLRGAYAASGDAGARPPPRARPSRPWRCSHAIREAAAAAGGRVPARRRFGQSLRQIAQLIKADVGVEMAFADVGGWDHHVNEGARQLPACCATSAQSLAAFCRDLGDRMDDVVVVTMSEFGRTARENGNRGTDHGHANCMFVMGGAVRGRQGLRPVAGPGAGAALRRPRPAPHHRLPRRARRTGGAPPRTAT